MRTAILVMFVTVIALAALMASSERNQIALLNQQGFINQGGKLGVSIGQSVEGAAATLQRSNLQFFDNKNGGPCGRHRYPSDTKVTSFVDSGWRKITFCIGSKGGKVTSIQWLAMTFAPEL